MAFVEEWCWIVRCGGTWDVLEFVPSLRTGWAYGVLTYPLKRGRASGVATTSGNDIKNIVCRRMIDSVPNG
jgi:hypothetical protein